MDHRFDKPQVLTPYRSLRKFKTFSPSNKLNNQNVMNNNASIGPEINIPSYIEDEKTTRTPNASPNLFPSPPFTPPPDNIRPNKNTSTLEESKKSSPEPNENSHKVSKEVEIRNEESVIIKPPPRPVVNTISFISTPKIENKNKKLLSASTNNQILEFYTPPPKEQIKQEKITYTSVEPILIKEESLHTNRESRVIKRTINESYINEDNEEINQENIKPSQASKYPSYIPFNWKTFVIFAIIQIISFLIYTLIMWLFVWSYIKNHYSIRTTENGELSVNSLSIYKGDFEVNDIYTNAVVNEMNNVEKSSKNHTFTLTKQLIENNKISNKNTTISTKQVENREMKKSSKSLRHNPKIERNLAVTYDTTHHLSIDPSTDELYISSHRLTSDELLIEGNSYFKGNIIMGDPLKNTTILVNGNIVFNTHNITVKNINIENGLISNSMIKGNSIIFDRNTKYKVPFINDEGKFDFLNDFIYSNGILTTKSIQSKEINNIENINKLEPSVLHIYDSIKTTNYLFEEGNNKFTLNDGLISDKIQTLFIKSKTSDPITFESDISGNNVNKISKINRIEVNEIKGNDEIIKVKSDLDFGTKSIKMIDRIDNMKEMTIGTINIIDSLHVKSIDNGISSIDMNSDVNMKNKDINNIKSLYSNTINVETLQRGNSDNTIKVSSKLNLQNTYDIVNVREIQSNNIKVNKIESKDGSTPLQISSDVNINRITAGIINTNTLKAEYKIDVNTVFDMNNNDINNVKLLNSKETNINELHVKSIDNNANAIDINSEMNVKKIMKVNTIESLNPSDSIEIKSNIKTDHIFSASSIKVESIEGGASGNIKISSNVDIGTYKLSVSNLNMGSIALSNSVSTPLITGPYSDIKINKDLNLQSKSMSNIKQITSSTLNIANLQSSSGSGGNIKVNSDLDMLNNDISGIKEMSSGIINVGIIQSSGIITVKGNLDLLSINDITNVNNMKSNELFGSTLSIDNLKTFTGSSINILSGINMNSMDISGISTISSGTINVGTIMSSSGSTGTIMIYSNLDMLGNSVLHVNKLQIPTVISPVSSTCDKIGEIYFDLTNDKIYICNGSKFVEYSITPSSP